MIVAKPNGSGKTTFQYPGRGKGTPLIPRAVTQRYNDAFDRRIVKTVVPSWDSISSILLWVPYLNQLDIPDIGDSACASASTAMVLAYYGKIQKTRYVMIDKAEQVFDVTSSVSAGLLGACST